MQQQLDCSASLNNSFTPIVLDKVPIHVPQVSSTLVGSHLTGSCMLCPLPTKTPDTPDSVPPTRGLGTFTCGPRVFSSNPGYHWVFRIVQAQWTCSLSKRLGNTVPPEATSLLLVAKSHKYDHDCMFLDENPVLATIHRQWTIQYLLNHNDDNNINDNNNINDDNNNNKKTGTVYTATSSYLITPSC